MILVENASRFARDLAVQLAGHALLRERGIELVPVDAPTYFTDPSPTAEMVRQILGAVSQFEKANLVAKLRHARERLRASAGRCEGRKAVPGRGRGPCPPPSAQEPADRRPPQPARDFRRAGRTRAPRAEDRQAVRTRGHPARPRAEGKRALGWLALQLRFPFGCMLLHLDPPEVAAVQVLFSAALAVTAA